MQRRPSGVTFSAVVLGLISLFLLFGGFIYIVLAVVFARSPQLALSTTNNGAPPPQQLVVGIMVFFALVALACAAWGISTMVGLLRMKNWARISIMVIGGCLAALSLIELFGCVIVQLTMKNMVLPPNADSANPITTSAMQGVFLFLDGFCLAVTAIGVWWLVYFARRATSAAFRLAKSEPPATLSSIAHLNPAMPITDFSVAQPLEAVQPIEPPPAAEAPVTAIVPSAPSRPISMIIIAIFLFLGSLSMVLCCLMPYPLFFFGGKISGAPEYVLLFSLAAVYALAGFGLLQRKRFGWLLAIGINLLGLLNLLTLFSPHVRDRYMAYMQSLSQSMAPAMPDASQVSAQMMQQSQMIQQKMMAQLMVPMLGLGGVFILFILVLLWRARWWYSNSE